MMAIDTNIFVVVHTTEGEKVPYEIRKENRRC